MTRVIKRDYPLHEAHIVLAREAINFRDFHRYRNTIKFLVYFENHTHMTKQLESTVTLSRRKINSLERRRRKEYDFDRIL